MAPSAFDAETGLMKKKSGAPPAYSDVVGDALIDICKQDDTVVGITAAMAEGTGLCKLHDVIPDRYFDVGIAEQHAVTFAADSPRRASSRSSRSIRPSLQRAMTRSFTMSGVQNLPVTFVLDRAGIVGEEWADAARRL